MNRGYNRCLDRTMTCTHKAIKAHSIQNSKVIDLLENNGHLIMPLKKMKKDGPVVCFGLVGRNDATTFEGLCKEHDNNYFFEIDTKEINPENTFQLFLLAYRSIIRELHATFEYAIKAQSLYQDKAKLLNEDMKYPESLGLYAVERMVIAYETFKYRTIFDSAMDTGDFSKILHDYVLIDTEPTISCSTLASVDSMINSKGETSRFCLNILPLDKNKTLVLISYVDDDRENIEKYFHRILTADGYYQKYLISKIVLNHCENIIISPTYFDKWSIEKKQDITKYFISTLYENILDVENEMLFLF
jgi:hypothetical protein